MKTEKCANDAGGWLGRCWDSQTNGVESPPPIGLVGRFAIDFTRIKEECHLPAVLKFGYHNACPPPEVHCAFHREWQARFGAEIAGVSLTSAIIECLVQRPPATKEEATALAWEHFWYCPDIVD